ncbi:hypothetical protein AG1IA_01776 [Rhizoctonia solani AG-1 IA]|uniref:Uncharacterized protein n=1 Tax=Thanatephorus cucumeris (strain AG1-IA) TaxID=983506 RepID=L8X6C2_THACA|nr:hypothetical protein AG1IA_01776 [Rhizoctonia solani AG-1 IA]
MFPCLFINIYALSQSYSIAIVCLKEPETRNRLPSRILNYLAIQGPIPVYF